MKTTIDIPDGVLEEALQHSGAKTKREAVVTAVADYNRRQRMAALSRHLGSCRDLMTVEQLRRMRESE
jgi:Arc/MetJ family transcription regulator